MMKILMVCLGNICRSPMAEGIMQHRLNEAKIPALVDSAGMSAWHEGEKPDNRVIQECKKNNIDISAQRARPFAKSDFDKFDVIYAMDQSNYDNIVKLAASDTQKAKVKLIMDEAFPGKSLEVPDPYYGTQENFTHVFSLLDNVTSSIVTALQK